MKKALSVLLIMIVATGFPIASYCAKGESPNVWIQKEPMPTSRADFGAVSVNGIIYAIGGLTGPQVALNSSSLVSTNVNEAYDPATDSWTGKAPMPIGLSYFGVAVYQNKVYCIGQNQNEVYDTTANSWQTKTPMPAESYQMQANVVGNKIYVIGGYPNGSVNEVYDPATDSWTTQVGVPTPVADYASAVVGNKIYFISGEAIVPYPNGEQGVTTNLTQIYDTTTDSWSLGAAIPMGVAGAAAAEVEVSGSSAIYVMGGCSATYPLDAQVVNQVYFVDNNTWGIGAPMPADKAGLSVVALNGALYALGGGHNIFTKISTANMQYIPFGTSNLNTSTGQVPELSWLVIIPLTICVFSVMILRKRQDWKGLTGQAIT